MDLPHAQSPTNLLTVLVRTSGEPMSMAAAVREQVRALDKDVPVTHVQTMEKVLGASVAQPRFSMLLAGRLTGRIDSRLLVGIGVALMGISLWMMTGFAIDQPSTPVIMSGVVQGLGLGLIFVPLQSLAFETLLPRMRTTAASLLNLARNIGGSVGISVVITQLVRMTQVAHADISQRITEQTIPTADPVILQTAIPVAGPAALAYINAMITKQALFIAYLDDFKLMMIVTFSVLPLLLFMKRGEQVGGAGPPVHMD